MSSRAVLAVIAYNREPDCDLTPLEFLVLVNIAEHHNQQSGQCNPGTGLLARECRIDRRNLDRVLMTLEEKKAIRIERGHRGRGHSHQYELMPLEKASSARLLEKAQPTEKRRHEDREKASSEPLKGVMRTHEPMNQPRTEDHRQGGTEVRGEIQRSRSSSPAPSQAPARRSRSGELGEQQQLQDQELAQNEEDGDDVESFRCVGCGKATADEELMEVIDGLACRSCYQTRTLERLETLLMGPNGPAHGDLERFERICDHLDVDPQQALEAMQNVGMIAACDCEPGAWRLRGYNTDWEPCPNQGRGTSLTVAETTTAETTTAIELIAGRCIACAEQTDQGRHTYADGDAIRVAYVHDACAAPVKEGRR